jgi:hypothetical protein
MYIPGVEDMDALARAVVAAMAFLELSDDQDVDPDCALGAMESICYELQSCTDAEKAALKKALAAELQAWQAQNAKENVIEFYRDFMVNTGLEQAE